VETGGDNYQAFRPLDHRSVDYGKHLPRFRVHL
jgi:hypothetical protein